VHGKGWLVSGPSNSPEHGGLVMGPAMDHQIIRWLLGATAEAADVLKVDGDLARQCRAAAARIAPDRVGSGGQLREWLYTEHYKTNHRHVSHLWALHPGEQITPQTPELFEAARQTLIYRGDGGTGWSMAWKINFWARLLDGDHALRMLANLTKPVGRGGGLYPNLFDACPPFQIDGNFGLTSGIVEMLVQSHRRDEQGRYIVDLLPALPSAWTSGSVQGLRVRGGGTVSLTWRDGRLVSHTVDAKGLKSPRVRYQGKFIE
jgi:alpha-L-fucosidase 2